MVFEARREDRAVGAQSGGTCGSTKSLGGQAISIPTDVSDADAVEGAANKSSVHFDNGGFRPWVRAWHTFRAAQDGCRATAGPIIQIRSALAYCSVPLQSASCACKHAINGFTDSLRCELYHHKSNVKITAIHMPP